MSTQKQQDPIHQPSNSMVFRSNKKTLFLHKLMEKDDNLSPFLTEINSHFNSVDKYLDMSGQLVIGKRIHVNEIVKTQSRASISKKSPMRKQKRGTEKENTFSRLSTVMKNIIDLNSEDSIMSQAHYEIIDNKKLKSIFDSYKDNSFKQESKSPALPSIIENSLLSQKKYLQIKTEEDLRSKSMAKYLSKQLNKPESELLINRIDSFRMKKEVLNSIDNQIPLEQKYGQYKWNISLRRPERFRGKRDAYINIRTDSNPFWAKINERYPSHVQMSIKPTININSGDYRSFKKNPYLRATSADKVKSVESMNNLIIKGKDLYKVEYDHAFKSQGNKILHRMFVHNGKNILDKDINHYYGNEMLYENYNDDTLKNSNMRSFNSSKFR